MDDDRNDNEIPEDEERPARHGFRRFLIFLLILVTVLAVVLAAAYRDGTGLDMLRRYFSYGSAEKSGGSSGYSYDASTDNRFAVLGDSLVVLSDTELQVLDQDGKQTYSTAVKMTSPALASGGGCAVAYDVGGTSLLVVGQDGELLTLNADAEEPFISATLNSEGWLAVTSEKKNSKGWVSVYNNKMEQVFTFNSSRRFVTGAYVTDNCRDLAAVTLGQEDSVFVSNIVLYDLSQTDPVANYDVKDGLVLSIGELDSQIATVSDTSLTFGGVSGEIAGTYSFGGEYLREYSLGGDGFASLLLDRYQSGSVGRLVTVGADGTPIASLDVNEEVLGISAAGRYLAVLYSGRLVIYNQELQEYASLSGTDYARGVLMRPDGSALLVSSEKASLFLP
jgi:hypothetical protein